MIFICHWLIFDCYALMSSIFPCFTWNSTKIYSKWFFFSCISFPLIDFTVSMGSMNYHILYANNKMAFFWPLVKTRWRCRHKPYIIFFNLFYRQQQDKRVQQSRKNWEQLKMDFTFLQFYAFKWEIGPTIQMIYGKLWLKKTLHTLFAVMFLSIVEIFFICVLYYYMYNIHFDVQKDNSSSQQVTTHSK